MKSQYAVSLVELLITLFLITVLASVSLPGLKHFLDRSSDEALQSQLLHAINFARTEALIRHQPIALCKSNNGKTCGGTWSKTQLVFIDENENGSILNDAQILAVLQSPASHGALYWRAYPLYRDYLQFSSSGNLQNDNGSFWFCREKALAPAWALVLSKSGRTRIAYPDSQGKIKDSAGRVFTC